MSEPILTDIDMDRFLAQIDALAHAVAASGWRPDWLVGVGRGGLAPATWLSHAMGRPMLSVDMSAKLPAFGDALLAELASRAAVGEHILIVDDINDSGGTINRLRDAMGGASDDVLRIAVLMDNIRSAASVDYRAETIDRAVTKDWFVFPWEKVASRTSILADWGEEPQRTA
ncbi:phosphoribosyltransferase [Sphingobium lactosutens]|uniref:phosphoribosyltransferase n=1 Tax=Sphingobium lactosutens TaxID=522773 RepID=UPI0015B8A459|nr:phosphoribosyltransferase family protein [Sphingobium lactosutens]NWK94180.1 phosphoribosyltransferase [Sphingobium lactosutens]